MTIGKLSRSWKLALLLSLVTATAAAQSFRVQCPTSTITHPAADNNSEPAYSGPTQFTCSVLNGCGGTAGNVGYLVPNTDTTKGPVAINGAIKCQQISGGDGFATMGDGTQTYMFSFGPLSGLTDIANGLPGTQVPSTFNGTYTGATPLQPGDPATTDDKAGMGAFTFNGAVGLALDIPNIVSIYDIAQDPPTSATPNRVTVQTNAPLGLNVGDTVVIAGTGTTVPLASNYDGTWTITSATLPTPLPSTVVNYGFAAGFNFTFNLPTTTGLADINESQTATAATTPRIDGYVDPRPIMDVGVMNGNIPAPLMAIDEDDEFFLTLSNVGMIMRPDLFEQHTVHFHGYPNASSFYDGVPDASVAINIGGSFTYYYLAPDAGTYFWHCHITPPEHLQMGMVGQIYVRPRQNRVLAGGGLWAALQSQQSDPRTACNTASDILCSNPMPPSNNAVHGNDKSGQPTKYAYNDGDGTTAYDVEYPLQIHGFDPDFHFVGMTFNPEAFADMKDKYFLLNGRSYPDTVTAGPMQTQTTDGSNHFSQPLPSIISIPLGGRVLLRISDLDVTEYQTLASLGIPMRVVGYNAKLLRDQAGNNLYYNTNSITLAGGESLDAVLDASDTTRYPANSVFYLYTPNLDHLSNDAENFGGLMTEVRICSGGVSNGVCN